MKKIRKLFAAALALCLLLVCTGCQNGQDEIYSQVMEESLPVSYSKESSMPEIDYDDPDYIGPARPDPEAQIAPITSDSLSGELLIKTFDQYHESPQIHWLAREFMDMHPNVSIEIEYDWTWAERLAGRPIAERNQRKEAYYARMRLELASGEADYLLWGAAADLDYTPFIRSGILEDLRPYWENDPDICDEDYFTEVIEAFDVDGKLPVTLLRLS